MSQYTTGEIAKLTGVSVRTVQYYDTRGILIPGALSEGGRRLYSEEDLSKMRIICFLRELGLPISRIGELLLEEHPEKVIFLLLEEQEKILRTEVEEREEKREKLLCMKRSLRNVEHFSVKSIGDFANVMKNKEKLKKVRTVLLSTAIPFGILEWVSLFLWIFKGLWWMFALYTLLFVPYLFWIFNYYWKNVSYICPSCHKVFKPKKKEAFFAKHTPTTRKLTCTCCGHKGYCVETCGNAEEPNEEKS